MEEIENKLNDLIDLCEKTVNSDSRAILVILLTARGCLMGGLLPILTDSVVKCSTEVLLPLITELQESQKAKLN